jgi:hypothetical protein
MKITIPNRDIDDPEETKDVTAVELDLSDLQASQPPAKSPDFSAAITVAAARAADALKEEGEREKARRARAMFEEGQRALADLIKQETGQHVGYGTPWTFKPKAKAAYELWKRIIPMFIDRPETLDWGPTELACRLDAKEANFTITRDMMYDKLNRYAQADLGRLLNTLGVSLPLKPPVTIRSVQKQLIERRDANRDLGLEEFRGEFVIRGDTAYVNGKGYKIQLGDTGLRRIRRRGRSWLPLDTLKEFCTG